MQDHYDNFFEDVFVECEDKYGQVGGRLGIGGQWKFRGFFFSSGIHFYHNKINNLRTLVVVISLKHFV